MLPRVIREQAAVGIDLHIVQPGRGAAEKIHPLLLSEHRLLGQVCDYQHDDPVKHRRRAADNIQMAIGDRVKAARTDRCYHTSIPF